MRDREDIAGGFVFVRLKHLPQILRIVASKRSNRRIRLNLFGLVGTFFYVRIQTREGDQ